MAISTALAVLLHSREHGWGDDFAAYIMQARSLSMGGVSEYIQTSSFIVQNSSYWYVPVTYPWGFPLLLSPLLRIFGVKLLVLKLVATGCFAVFLAVFFFFARRRLRDPEALLLTAVLGTNPVLLSAQNEIGPDLPFLLFSILALWLIDLTQDESSQIRPGVLVALGCTMFMAAFTRSNGLVILAPLVVVHTLRLYRHARGPGWFRRELPRLAVPYATLALLYGVQALVLPSSPYDALGIFGSATASSVLANAVYYFWLPASAFGHLGWGAGPAYLLAILGVLVGLVRMQARDVHLHVFVLALLLPYVVMPAVQGIRYVFPLLAVVLVLAYQGMESVPRWIRRMDPAGFRRALAVLWFALALWSAGASATLAERNLRAGLYPLGRSDGAYSPAADEMFEYIRKHTPQGSIVMFFRPRAMALRAERLAFQSRHCERLTDADYVVLVGNNPDVDQIPRAEVDRCNPAVVLTPVYEKDEFVVFQISPAG